MAEENIPERDLPKDIAQLPVVWRYELLKYLRSRRLIAAIALVIAVVALIYFLPPAFGHPYKGTDTNEYVTVNPLQVEIPGVGTISAYGAVNRSNIDPATLTIYRDGVEFPKGPTNWTLIPSISLGGMELSNIILFTGDVTGHTFTADYDWSVTAESFATLFMNFVTFLVIICATFFGADAIVSEYQNRTGYLIFPNPVRRSTLFFGKYAASMTAGIMVMLLFYAAIILLSYVTFGDLADGFGLSFALAVEFLAAAVAIAYLISSILKGSTGALVLTFFMFLLILPIIDGVSLFTNVKINWSLTFAAGAIIYVLMHPYPVDSTTQVPGFGSFGNFYPSPEMAAVVMATYAVIALVLSLFLFRRKQLLG